MSERIENLRETVETMHECKARHVASKRVIEVFRGKIVWDGIVETFDLQGHPQTKRCYAWSFTENGEPKYTTVLQIPPVFSPQTAVKVAIASKGREEGRK